VGVEDAVNVWAGKGTIIPKKLPDTYGTSGGTPDEHWSDTYQWLPANVAFEQDGSVKFTSYINNIHPIKHRDIYDTIERLVENSLPLWDQCLALGGSEDAPGIVCTRLDRSEYPE
jgi:hypothetical protein